MTTTNSNSAPEVPGKTDIPAVPGIAVVPVADWNLQKKKLLAKFSYLTEADLNYEPGKRDEMLNRVQIKIGKTKDELTAIFAGL